MSGEVTRPQAIQALQDFHQREGRSPTITEWREGGLSPAARTIQRLFPGGWGSALDAAGLQRNRRYAAPRADPEQTRAMIARLRVVPIATVAHEFELTISGLRSRVKRYVRAHPGERNPFLAVGPDNGHVNREDEQLSDEARARLQRPRDY